MHEGSSISSGVALVILPFADRPLLRRPVCPIVQEKYAMRHRRMQEAVPTSSGGRRARGIITSNWTASRHFIWMGAAQLRLFVAGQVREPTNWGHFPICVIAYS